MLFKMLFLFGGLPLATDGGDDGAFFFQFGKGLVDFLTVGTQCLGDVANGDGLTGFAHGF